MTRLVCGPLAAWAGAWLNGRAAFDDVLTAASIEAPAPALAHHAPLVRTGHAVAVEPGQVSALGEVLIAWRQTRARVRLVLPVPGDTRGLPGPSAFRASALDAGQAVVGTGPDGSVAIVPLFVDRRPSSAPLALTWQRFDVDEPADDYVSITDAQFELTEAIRECASSLVRLQAPSADAGVDLSDELGAARRAGERINLPPGFAPKAVALIAQAERMAAVLNLAAPAPDPARADVRADVLAPLVLAVRRARIAGYNAAT